MMKTLFFCLAIFPLFACAQIFEEVPTSRPQVTMNILVNNFVADDEPKTALLIIPGSDGADGRVKILGSGSVYKGAMQYLYNNRDLFESAGILLVATGCPTDEWSRFGMCGDDYRKSPKYADDFSAVIQFLKTEYHIERFYLFGHSSGGISTRWLSVNLPNQFVGVINSSIMNGTAGNLASSTVGFDMTQIKAPVLNIGHRDDRCPSTPYYIVKGYSNNNLVTVVGGGSSGFVCGGANHHSFEDRQRGVSIAIVKWITTGEVQTIVDSDD